MALSYASISMLIQYVCTCRYDVEMGHMISVSSQSTRIFNDITSLKRYVCVLVIHGNDRNG